MIRGRTVTVLWPGEVGTDRFGEPVYGEPTTEEVGNVVIQRGESNDLEATRPDGTTADFTLHFPKAFGGRNLRGCSIRLYGEFDGVYRVIGETYPYQDENCPTPWNMPVRVVAVHG